MDLEKIMQTAKEKNESGERSEIEQPEVEQIPNEVFGLTQEQEDEIIKRRFNVDDLNLIIKKEVEISEEEKIRLKEEEEKEFLVSSIEHGFFTKADYDEYQRVKNVDKVELGKEKIKTELGIDDDESLNEVLGLGEADFFDEEDENGNEVKEPNKKKELGKAIISKFAEQFISSKFNKVLTAKEKVEWLKSRKANAAKNTQIVETAISTIPKEIDFELGGNSYKYKFNDNDLNEAKKVFLGDEEKLKGGVISKEDVVEYVDLFIKAKNLNDIIKEISEVRLAKERENYERGQRGIPTGSILGDATSGGITESQKIINGIYGKK